MRFLALLFFVLLVTLSQAHRGHKKNSDSSSQEGSPRPHRGSSPFPPSGPPATGQPDLVTPPEPGFFNRIFGSK